MIGSVEIHQKIFKQNNKIQIESGGDSPLFNKAIFSKTRELLGGRLKCMVAGGAPVDVKTQQFMSICMSCPLVIGYGLTETCAGGCVQVFTSLNSTPRLSGLIF